MDTPDKFHGEIALYSVIGPFGQPEWRASDSLVGKKGVEPNVALSSGRQRHGVLRRSGGGRWP